MAIPCSEFVEVGAACVPMVSGGEYCGMAVVSRGRCGSLWVIMAFSDRSCMVGDLRCSLPSWRARQRFGGAGVGDLECVRGDARLKVSISKLCLHEAHKM